MDNSSSELGPSAQEPKSETGKALDPSSETGGGPEGKQDLAKVLAYGPAKREAETSEDTVAPEVKADASAGTGAAPEVKADKIPPLHSATSDTKSTVVLGSALVPFIAPEEAKLDRDVPPADPVRPSRFEIFRSRGMQAAIVAAGLGLTWAFAGSFLSGQTAKTVPLQTAAVGDTIDLHHQNATPSDNGEAHRLAEEVRALKKELDGLRAAVAQNPAPEELRALKKSVDSMKNGLETTKSETAASLAQLAAKLDRAQHDPAKLREISERLDHMEHAALLTASTAAAAPLQEPSPKTVPVPIPPTKALLAPSAAATKPTSPQPPVIQTAQTSAEKPQLIANWVVRDVYDGIALVEGPHGSVEVIEGENIPGVGTVKSIERRGSGWIVVTSRGLVDSARNLIGVTVSPKSLIH